MLRYLPFLFLITFFAADQALAQEDKEDLAERTNTYTWAELKERIPPKYPRKALRSLQEGWVLISYVVRADGSIDEAMIEDSSGIEDFEDAALDMLDTWEYRPARQDGVAVDQSMTNYRVVFQFDEVVKGASQKFRRAYREIQKAITEEEFERADTLISNLQYDEKQNLYEDAWLWWLKYQYLSAVKGDNTSEILDTLRKAIGYDEMYLPPDIFVIALQELYILQAKNLNFGGAIASYLQLMETEEAKKSELYEQVVARLEPNVQKMLELVASERPLAQNARIGRNGFWFHTLLRDSFSIAEISGQLEAVQVRCSRRYEQYSVSESTIWTVPESWGACGVYVKGDEGSTFKLIEHQSGI